MARTTLNLDTPILRDLKRLQREEGKSLGELASEVLADGLAHRRSRSQGRTPFHWASHSMRARVDLTDKDAVAAILDARHSRRSR